jgi:hypothetical protein
MKKRLASRATRLLSLVALALLVPACMTPKKGSSLLIVGQATFPVAANGVTSSGISSLTESGMTIHYIDFEGHEVGGSGKLEFRWKPHMGLPYLKDFESDMASGGTWEMSTCAVYTDIVRRHRAGACTVEIAFGDEKKCTMK